MIQKQLNNPSNGNRRPMELCQSMEHYAQTVQNDAEEQMKKRVKEEQRKMSHVSN